MSKTIDRKALFTILAAATLAVMAGSIISPVISLMQGHLQGADENNIRFVITTHALFIALFSPLVGNLIDKFGAKKPFLFGLILYGLAGASGLFISNIVVMIISRVFLGIAVAAIANPLIVLILNAYKGEECSKIMGWQASASALGGIIWPLIGGALGVLAWNLPFSIYLTGLPLGFLAWFTIPDVDRTAKAKFSSEATENVSSLQIIKQKPAILTVYALGLWAMVLLYTNVTFIPQLLVDDFAISNSFIISTFIGVMGLSAAITAFLYKTVKSKLSYKSISLIGLGLWAFGFLLLSQSLSMPAIILSIVLYGIGQGMICHSKSLLMN